MIQACVKRASALCQRLDLSFDGFSCAMDLEAAHNVSPLKLGELVKADDENFAHDIWGIARHIDRETGKMGDCFLPRYTA